tara:strand:+ start:8512 stop:9201 length:690 start_codon:yes stop_codon:yes gene_type:complete
MTMNENHGVETQTETTATGDVATGQNIESQVEAAKTFTQEEVNLLVGKRVAAVNKKYENVDVEEYKALRGLKEQIEEESLIKKEDFNGVLKKQKEKSDMEVLNLRTELETIKIDGALINASSKAKAVSPDHVAQLLRKNITLGADGNVMVTDNDGKQRYTDNADPMTVDNLVEEFLSSNQYFKSAGPSGAGSTGNTQNANPQSLDLAQLDMNKPEHREIYKKMKAQGKV